MSISATSSESSLDSLQSIDASDPNATFVDPILRDHQTKVARATLDSLIERKHLSEEEATHIFSAFSEELKSQASVEILETIVRLSTTSPRDIPQFIRQLGNAVAKTLKRNVPFIPIAGRLQIPNAFYEDHDQVKPLCKAMLAPILFAEDSEVFGVGSINPRAALHTANLVADLVAKSEPVRPFTTVVRLDYVTWQTLLEKQFGL